MTETRTTVPQAHRIEIRPTTAHVQVLIAGEVVVDTRNALALSETGYADRFYVPRADVRVELEPSETRSFCPFKGQAAYVHATIGGTRVPDVAWTYPEPIEAAREIAGHLSFSGYRSFGVAGVTVLVDGERAA